ncbi:MAG: hypothetical protein ACRDZO_28995 [Egibacteraceae bacterium]
MVRLGWLVVLGASVAVVVIAAATADVRERCGVPAAPSWTLAAIPRLLMMSATSAATKRAWRSPGRALSGGGGCCTGWCWGTGIGRGGRWAGSSRRLARRLPRAAPARGQAPAGPQGRVVGGQAALYGLDRLVPAVKLADPDKFPRRTRARQVC